MAFGLTSQSQRNRLAGELRSLLKASQVLEEPEDLACYAFDASFEARKREHLPDAVVLAGCVEDVVAVVRYAAAHPLPIVPRGAGSGQAGGALPIYGGIVLNLGSMDRILEIEARNRQAFVEPGVVHATLNAALARQGLFFPPDPGSSKGCTIGGMAATNAHGMRAIKYGGTSAWVLGLQVVLASGEVITTGSLNSRALYSVSGIDLTRVFIGSEGTLGVITQLRLKLLPLPPARGLVLAAFDLLEKSAEAVMAVFREGILPSAVEILDSSALRAIALYRPETALPQGEALILLEVDGNEAGVAQDVSRVCETLLPLAREVESTTDAKRIEALWDTRRVLGAATSRLVEGGTRVCDGEDICVPISEMPSVLREVKELSERYGVVVVTYGHIGGGNIHPALVIRLQDANEVRRAEALAHEIHLLALRHHGTVTGEHGVGLSRLRYMEQEHGAALETMRLIKKALDPQNILNPGKVFPSVGAKAPALER